MECPYCKSNVELKNSSVIYGRDYGLSWICSKFPECDSYVGCHKGTDKPLGRLANRELRKLKNRAHAAFDPLWMRKKFKRRFDAYQWLAAKLGIHIGDCHIGMFNNDMCLRVIEICKDMENNK